MGTFVERDRSFAQIISFNISRNKKSRPSDSSKSLDSGGAPGGTRTPDLLVRSQTLYPTELHTLIFGLFVFSVLLDSIQRRFFFKIVCKLFKSRSLLNHNCAFV